MKCGLPGGTSATGGGTRNDAATCGDIVYRDQVCDACVTSKCCARDAKCSGNNECIAIFTCVNLCPATDKACVQHCLDVSQNGVADYNNFIDCVNGSCGTECATSSDGGSSCGTLTFGTQACDSCVNATCCSEDSRCSSNPTCIALVQCAAVCQVNDQACINDCETQQPNGVADYRALSACVVSGCGAKCP